MAHSRKKLNLMGQRFGKLTVIAPAENIGRAAVCFKGKRHYLGGCRPFEDAVKARKLAEEQFHDQFLAEYAEQAGA